MFPMKKLGALCMAALMALSAGAVITANYSVVPLPQKIQTAKAAGFALNARTVISYPKDQKQLANEAAFLRDYLTTMTGLKLAVKAGATGDNRITLAIDPAIGNAEGYRLEVDRSGMKLTGGSAAGVFYGVQTIRKSVPHVTAEPVVFPAVEISDYPRFAYRGAHLDPCRHFFPFDSVKKYIDILALHNMNKFHFHLTEDQGWRFESKKYPLLTKIGSIRDSTQLYAGKESKSNTYDPRPYGGFYTQKQLRELVKYAAASHIDIIPEVDLPGHMQAALASYPELGCTGGPYRVWSRCGVSEDVLCAGNEKVFTFIDDILDEIMDVFPSEYIHVGGDECPKVRWEKCPKCQAKIKELGYQSDENGTKEQKLQSHVTHHVDDFITSHGRKMIGWDEILEGGVSPNAVIMSWRGVDGALKATPLGHDVIMTPNNFCYFDYRQSDNPDEPHPVGMLLTFEKVYSLDPQLPELTEEQKKHILGVQANVWTEWIVDLPDVQYMALPRFAALAENQWSTAPKDLDGLLRRMPQMLDQYRANDYRFAPHLLSDPRVSDK